MNLKTRPVLRNIIKSLNVYDEAKKMKNGNDIIKQLRDKQIINSAEDTNMPAVSLCGSIQLIYLRASAEPFAIRCRHGGSKVYGIHVFKSRLGTPKLTTFIHSTRKKSRNKKQI